MSILTIGNQKSRIVGVVLAVLVLLCASCTGSEQEPGETSQPDGTSSSGTSQQEPSGAFDDHTVSVIESADVFDGLARAEGRQATVKFSIPDMLDSSDVYWMDSNFYELHDEWYWFQLLNGQPVPAIDVEPVSIEGQSFDSIDAIYSWSEGKATGDLPLDLQRLADDGRLYSPRFYKEAVYIEPRNYGVGSLIRFEAEEGVRWLFELEHVDEPTAEEIGLFIEHLSAALPDEIGKELAWVVRSPQQEDLAQQMESDDAPYGDRIVRYSELVKVGDVDVYNEGIAAGRLRIVADADYGISLAETTNDDLVIIENIPDWLPPAAAIVSSSPQTPLAHVNLLARNRGIPNVSLAGVVDNPGLRRAAITATPAVLHASGGELSITLLTEEEYSELRGGESRAPLAVPAVDLDDMETVVDLGETAEQIGSEKDIDALRPVIGGKSAGFLTLLKAEGVTTPQKPLAITVKPYFEHLAEVEDELQAMLDDDEFQATPQARYLLLEGDEDYDDVFPSDTDADIAAAFVGRQQAGTALSDILEAGGFKKFFRDVAMAPDSLAAITDALETNYGDYSATQGIRFRSSSSVEDLEGFSGAGLYDSNTGFLAPEAQESEKDQKKSVEYSIKKTWASYWSFEAFEERTTESIDHRSGGMGVLVHARFDDDLEQTNGVATFTILPEGNADQAVAMINVQEGDVSVANPDPEDPQLPEILEIRQADDGTVTINRLAPSTLADGEVIDDDQAIELFDQLQASANMWLERTNLDVTLGQQAQVVTLDFEFKHMAAGWPARSGGESPEPARLVVKQARSLDPGLRGIPEELIEADLPRDVLARARSVERFVCPVDGGGLDDIYLIYTDAQAAPDMGYSDAPLLISTGRSQPPQLDELEDCPRSTLLANSAELLLQIANDPDRTKLVDSATS